MFNKNIISLSNLLEVRRLLRSIRLNTNTNSKQLKTISKYLKTSRITKKSDKLRIKHCASIAVIIKITSKNIQLLQHAKMLLDSHLQENTNLHKKLYGLNNALIEENVEIKQSAENAVSNMTTEFAKPLSVMVKDLAKKLKVEDIKLFSDGEDTWAVIVLELKERLFCVLWNRELFYLKTYLNELPIELNESNSIEIKSPAHAYNVINKIIREDNL